MTKRPTQPATPVARETKPHLVRDVVVDYGDHTSISIDGKPFPFYLGKNRDVRAEHVGNAIHLTISILVTGNVTYEQHNYEGVE